MVYSNTAVYGEMSIMMVIPVIGLFFPHFFEALDDAFEVQFFQGFTFTP